MSAVPGEPHLAYRDGRLHVERTDAAALAEAHGTPLFVYSKAAILAALAPYQRVLSPRGGLVCYAMKANSNLALLRLLAAAGCGFDIVSGGELQRLLAAGADPARVVFSGVGKTAAEMRLALGHGIACFNVESVAELERLAAVAAEMGRRAPISLRVNPDVDARTHPYISTGLKSNKFGVAHDEALALYRRAAALPQIAVTGIGAHIGSQITEVEPYLDALERLLDLAAQCLDAGIALAHLDLGGGLGIRYDGESPPAADALLERVAERLDARGFGHMKLLVEPGRSLVGNAGVLLTRVEYLKPGAARNFCIVDAAMNDLARPAMYESYHRIEPVQPRSDLPTELYDVVGPVCESGDWLGRDRRLALAPGDLLAIFSAGAYGMTMASNYNTRPRAAELLVDGEQARLVRRRERVEQLYADELPLP